jgi:tyrosyl-tRNA synthetase
VHGEEGLEKALKVTAGAAPGSEAALSADVLREIAKDMPSVELSAADVIGQKYVDVVAKMGFLPSKSEAVRLIQNAGAYLNNERIDDVQAKITEEMLIEGEFLLFGSGKKKKMIAKVKK